MSRLFVLAGAVSVQLIPVFTITYLQHELATLPQRLEHLPSRLLSAVATWIAVGLLYANVLLGERWIAVIVSALLINVLSMSIHYTYKDYTVDEGSERVFESHRKTLPLGFHISIPCFIIYSCLVFVVAKADRPFFGIEPATFSITFICSLVCHALFTVPTLLGMSLRASCLNYIAFLGLAVATFNVVFIIERSQFETIEAASDILLLQLVHVYLYLTHLLSVAFEMNLTEAPATPVV